MKRMTPDEWRAFLLDGKRKAVEGEFLIRVPLTKVTARKGVADW